MDDATLMRLADLAVGFGCNLQEGQILAISGEPGKERMVRAVAESAYKRGAKFVDVGWFDPWVKRARIQYAAEDTLDFVPPWLGDRVLALGEHHAARVALSGPVAPGLLEDLDPVRAGRDRLPSVKEAGKVVEITGISIHRVVDGKLVEHWANADLYGFMQQLGALPTPAAAPH